MDVILMERVDKLGNMGEVVKVKPGFARNYLLPQKKALRATKDNREYFESQRSELEATNAAQRTDAQGLAGGIDGAVVIIVRQASDSGQLYGSVRPRDIADALKTLGHDVDRTQVRRAAPIKMIGMHKIAVALHPEVVVEVTANVARSEDEAELQAQGKSLVANAREEEREAEEETRAAIAEAAAEAEAEEEAEANKETEGPEEPQE
jgi:large subunit ribosomal protein L9